MRLSHAHLTTVYTTCKFYLEAVINLHETAYLQGLTEPDEFQHANLRLLKDQQLFNKFVFDWLTLPSVRGYVHLIYDLHRTLVQNVRTIHPSPTVSSIYLETFLCYLYKCTINGDVFTLPIFCMTGALAKSWHARL